jgi:SAM-dependent methyltransferase
MNKKDTTKNYEHYLAIQIMRSNKKWSNASFQREVFHIALNDVLPILCQCKNICCMGIRGGDCLKGNEFGEFKDHKDFKDAMVYGVDISPKVSEVKGDTFCLDFNNLPAEWKNKFDLIYSNSLDHSNDVEKTITEWHRVLEVGGYMLLALSTSPHVGGTDIFPFNIKDVETLFDNRFGVVKVWEVINQTHFFNVLIKKIK